VNGAPASENPRVQRLLAAARDLRSEIIARRCDIEHERRLPPSLVRALSGAGLFDLWLPCLLDGPELSIADFIRVIEEVAYADGSAGWCVAIAAGYSRLAGYLSSEVAQTIFGAGHAILAGTLNPMGRAKAVPGGWRIDGRWTYASGIRHATWLIANCVVEPDKPEQTARQSPEIRLMLFPAERAEIIDTWHVSGLRGSGSHDFRINDLFVAADHSIPGFDAPPRLPGPLYALPFVTTLAVNVAAVSLGIARASIDAMLSLAEGKISQRATTPLRFEPRIQSDIARAEASLRAARAFLFEAVADLWNEVTTSSAASLRSRALVRLACAQAAALSAQAVDLMYNAGGGTSLYEDCPLERCFRDTHAVTQHMAVSAINYELSGRVLLGLDPGTPRF
jgi:alkylation response protein AidB-like acyl-CoA dehydrogenase